MNIDCKYWSNCNVTGGGCCSLNLFGGKPSTGVCLTACSKYTGDKKEALKKAQEYRQSLQQASAIVPQTKCCGKKNILIWPSWIPRKLHVFAKWYGRPAFLRSRYLPRNRDDCGCNVFLKSTFLAIKVYSKNLYLTGKNILRWWIKENKQPVSV